MSDLLTAQSPKNADAECSATRSACACGTSEGSSAQSPPTPASGNRVRLTRMRVGDTGRVCGGRLDNDDRDMLRALGLRPDARVRLARVGEPCIVQVLGKHGCSCRIGLARPLAERVIIAMDDAQSGR